MRDIVRWRADLLSMIEEFADEQRLRDRWSGAIPNIVASFNEDVSILYDDLSLDEFTELRVSETGLSRTQFDAVTTFRDRFDAFWATLDPQEQIAVSKERVLADPLLKEVTRAARRVVDLSH